jgi:phage-related protein
MNKRFEIEFLDEAFEYLQGLERKHYKKILYNIRKVQVENDPKHNKKLTGDIWEFRTLYEGLKYRLFAFWDKTSCIETLVVCTHGFIKKRGKVPDYEIHKAIQSRKKYFEDKQLIN